MELRFIKDIKKSSRPCLRYDGKKKYIDTGNVKGTMITGFEEYSFDDKPSRANICVHTGDVLLAKMQNSIKVLVITEENENFIYSTGFYAFRDERILPDFLKYIFLSPSFNHEKDIRCTGGTQKAINDNSMKEITIDIPSIEIQKSIVEELDLVSMAINCEQKKIQLYDELIKSRFVEVFGNPLRPIKYKKLGEIALLERGKFTPRPRNDPRYFNGKFPFIQTGDISSSNHRLKNYRQTLNDLGITVSKKFNIGTIIMAIVGATIGATAILEREVYAPDSVVGITPYTYNNYFLETLLQFWRPELLAIAPECARANINLAILKEIPVIEVDEKLQKDFAKYVINIDKAKENCLKTLGCFNELVNRKMEEVLVINNNG